MSSRRSITCELTTVYTHVPDLAASSKAGGEAAFFGFAPTCFLLDHIKQEQTTGASCHTGLWLGREEKYHSINGAPAGLIPLTGYVLSRRLDTRKYIPIVLSPRSYFVFTPLLNDAAVGTLEFRATVEPVRRQGSGVEFVQGWADRINFADKVVHYNPSVRDPNVGHALAGEQHAAATTSGTEQKQTVALRRRQISYDKLVLAVGASPQTFKIEGVYENAMFLKDIGDARKIRRRVLELFELASQDTCPIDIRRYLLHFAIVGGGPTGMEFAAQLSDLIRQDLRKLYPDLEHCVRITLYDVAPKVLPMFDASLVDYAVKSSRRRGIDIKTSHHVEELRRGLPNSSSDPAGGYSDSDTKGGVYTIRTKEDGDIGVGMCVWATGNKATAFIRETLDTTFPYPSKSAEIVHGDHDGGGSGSNSNSATIHATPWRIQRNYKSRNVLVDDSLRVKVESVVPSLTSGHQQAQVPVQANASLKNVWCIGDAAQPASHSLPATAQVANQQAIWLAKHLNTKREEDENVALSSSVIKSGSSSPAPPRPPPVFRFKPLGVMTYIGDSKALFQGSSSSSSSSSNATNNSSPSSPSSSSSQSSHHQVQKVQPRRLRGLMAFLLWRAAYMTMTLSWRNRILVPMYWVITRVFGRDVSRF